MSKPHRSNTLDRLQRFSFGGSRSNSKDRKNDESEGSARKTNVRSNSEKTERLRELTEKLKGLSPQAARSPLPKRANRNRPLVQQPSTEETTRKIPFKSVSFSQVDFSSVDGKYTRRKSDLKEDLPEERSLTHPLGKRALSRCGCVNQHQRNQPSESTIPSVVDDINNQCGEVSEKVQTELNQPRTRNSCSAADKSRKRKGVYITKWPTTTKEVFETIPTIYLQGNSDNETWTKLQDDCTPEEWYGDPPQWPQTQLTEKSIVDSLSESESENRTKPSIQSDKSDISDCESTTTPRRYSKRPLRGPYGQMLEAEMKKPSDTNKICKLYYNKEFNFLDDLKANIDGIPSMSVQPIRTRSAGNRSLDETHTRSDEPIQQPQRNPNQRKTGATALNPPIPLSPFVRHQRTTSSPSKLEGILSSTDSILTPIEPNLKCSDECLLTTPSFLESTLNTNDTRTHIVVELYDTERSYVESLNSLVTKYLEPLKSSENASLQLDPGTVDDIFYQVPALLSFHERFLDELHKRLENWEPKQKIGDVFLEVFTKPAVLETYITFVNNWKKARDTIKSTAQSKPGFNRFLESMARENKGKHALDSLLIKPIQKFPKYEMLIQRLIKHTDTSHPDRALLQEAEIRIHECLLKINCTEQEMELFEIQQQHLRDLEMVIEGLDNLVCSDRFYIRHDLVIMVTPQGTRKDRAIFLFNDLLIVTGIKRRSGTVRKPTQTTACPTSALTLDTHKYKLLMRISLSDLELRNLKTDDTACGDQVLSETDAISKDLQILTKITNLSFHLQMPRDSLDEIVREMIAQTTRQLAERNNPGVHATCLELNVKSAENDILTILFPKDDIRQKWEDIFLETKQKLALSPSRRVLPQFMVSLPLRKQRSGLLFTCATPVLCPPRGPKSKKPAKYKEVWICNTDGFMGQVCVLNVSPQPVVQPSRSILNARITCMETIPPFRDTHKTNLTESISDIQSSVVSESFASTATYTPTYQNPLACDTGSVKMDSSTSSESETEDVDEIPLSIISGCGSQTLIEDNLDEDGPTVWLGTEEGFVHIYRNCDALYEGKTLSLISLSCAIQAILYYNNKIFMSLLNGDLIIFNRNEHGCWNITDRNAITIATPAAPIITMLENNQKIWCGGTSTIKILDSVSLKLEHTINLSNDGNAKQLCCMTTSGLGVWLATANSPVVKCYHATSRELICEVNIAPTVSKMLASSDDIIRQHKAACLRVTSLLPFKNLLWVGTSAGVVLTVVMPHINERTERITSQFTITGLTHGHTGQVRFLSFYEDETPTASTSPAKRCARKSDNPKIDYKQHIDPDHNKFVIVTGGDGYENFMSTNVSETVGREDSTNYVNLWNI